MTFSPLFIGEGSSTRVLSRIWAGFQPFSPLFIGEGSSTLVPHQAGLPGARFQSPLHRGRVFNGLMPDEALLLRAWPFSPLFIGEGSSTAPQSGPCRAASTFQSPLHRGRVFNEPYRQ